MIRAMAFALAMFGLAMSASEASACTAEPAARPEIGVGAGAFLANARGLSLPPTIPPPEGGAGFFVSLGAGGEGGWGGSLSMAGGGGGVRKRKNKKKKQTQPAPPPPPAGVLRKRHHPTKQKKKAKKPPPPHTTGVGEGIYSGAPFDLPHCAGPVADIRILNLRVLP